MPQTSYTLGEFIADLMRKHQHNNVSLANAAGISEGVIRNLLKHGSKDKTKDPDPRTLRRVADALEVDALMLFRLAGYIHPEPAANSVRAEYIADVFDELPPEKQDAVIGVVEAMTDKPKHRKNLQTMRSESSNPLAGIEEANPSFLRYMANELIVLFNIRQEADIALIPEDATVAQFQWGQLSSITKEKVKALILRKLSLDFDPTMVDSEWRK